MKNNTFASLLASLILAASLVLPVAAEEYDYTTISKGQAAPPPTISFAPPSSDNSQSSTAESDYIETGGINGGSATGSTDETDSTTSTTNDTPPSSDTTPDTSNPQSNPEDNTSSNNSSASDNSQNKPDIINTIAPIGRERITYETRMSLPDEEVSQPPVVSPISPDEKTTNVSKQITTKDGIITVEGIALDDRGMAVIDLVNKERKAAGLKPLTYDPKLAEATLLRALESSINWSHTRPDDTQWYTVSPLVNGENLAKGYRTAEEVMVGWMNSTGHRENILRSNFTRICVVCVKTDNGYLWIQLFGM